MPTGQTGQTGQNGQLPGQLTFQDTKSVNFTTKITNQSAQAGQQLTLTTPLTLLQPDHVPSR